MKRVLAAALAAAALAGCALGSAGRTQTARVQQDKPTAASAPQLPAPILHCAGAVSWLAPDLASWEQLTELLYANVGTAVMVPWLKHQYGPAPTPGVRYQVPGRCS